MYKVSYLWYYYNGFKFGILLLGGRKMDKYDDLARKKEVALAGGGETNVQMQHGLNKMTARERIAFLVDGGSFVEVGAMVGGNGAGVITGYGTVNGRLIYIYSEDFTVEAGLISVRNSKKIATIMEMALRMGAPLIQIIDSAGAKLSEGLDILSGYGRIIGLNAKLSGIVPQISVIAGPCTGLSAVGAAMSDIAIIADNCGEMYVNSPNAIEEATKQHVEGSMYADAVSSVRNGSVQLSAKDDKEALNLVRNLMTYLPSNNIEFAPVDDSGAITVTTDAALDNLVNADARALVASIADEGSVIEFDMGISKAVATVLAKINGQSVGIIASDKNCNEGRLDIKTCDKIARFVKLCDSFNISLITLVDTKGFILSAEEENNGLALSASKMIYALSEASVPKVAVITGEAYGSAYVALAGKEASFDVVYAWPSAKIAITEPAKIIEVLYKDEIVSSENPKLKQKELLDRYLETEASPYRAAEEGYVDDVLAPSETSVKLFMTLDMLQSKRLVKYPKKHGNVIV
jgi:methylmalonyl-CoA decarboxylase subunit alpha